VHGTLTSLPARSIRASNFLREVGEVMPYGLPIVTVSFHPIFHAGGEYAQ
jgi:hypothetical protein